MSVRKLVLATETLQALQPGEAREAAAGRMPEPVTTPHTCHGCATYGCPISYVPSDCGTHIAL